MKLARSDTVTESPVGDLQALDISEPLTRHRSAPATSPDGRGENSFSRREKVPKGRMRGVAV